MPKKIRIVQVECFYSKFLDDFYRTHVALADKPFADQIDAMLESGFSGGHNTVPCLNPQYWDTHYLIPNCSASQLQWSREHISDEATPGLAQILEAQLRAIDPDVLYLSDIPGFDFGILDRLPRLPFVVGWHASVVDARIPWHRIDLILSGIQHIRDAALALGAKAAETFMPAAPPYRNQMHSSIQGSHDLVFSGSFSGSIHQERAIEYKALSRQIGGHQIALYTPAAFPVEPGEQITVSPAVFGRDVLNLYARANIVLDSRGDFQLPDQGMRETSNMRIFEATRAGALLITEHCSNLEQYFRINEEIITYHSTDELVQKVNFYLDPRNEPIRLKIAAAGYARVMRDHLLEHRATWLERILIAHFEQHTAPAPNRTPATNVTPHRQVFCTIARADNVLFSLHTVQSLQSLFPGLPVVILCMDNTARRILSSLVSGVELLDTEQVLSPPHREVHHEIQQWLLPPLLLRTAMRLYPKAGRVTYVHPSVLVQDAQTLEFADTDVDVCLLNYGFTEPYVYEGSVLGHAAMDLFSVANNTDSVKLFTALAESTPAPEADVDGTFAANLVVKLQASGLPARLLRTATPWNYPATQRPGLFLFAMVRRLATNNYQLLSFGELAGWENCYSKVYETVFEKVEALGASLSASEALGIQELSNVDARVETLLFKHQSLDQQGYRRITSREYAATATFIEGWNTQTAATAQHQAFQYLIEQFRGGNQRADLLALQSILGKIQRPNMLLLETGCGSGYLNTFITEAVGDAYTYSGVDLAPAMVALARSTYPALQFEVMSSSRLDFPDRSFNVVLNGASLMHTIEFEQAIQEAARVAGDFAIFHTVTVVDSPQNIYFTKNGYGSKVAEVCFSESVLAALLARNHLQPVLVEKSIDYDLGLVFGPPTRSLSIACLRHDPLTGESTDSRNHYCAYFDSNYLTRAMLMVESLKCHDPLAHFYLLCLDKTAEVFLTDFAPHITPISIGELQTADPEFAACKNNRSLVEWYFTATSVLCHFLLRTFPTIARLTYLDSDLFFYASPAILHAESVGKSVQIIEHRFSPHMESLARYGRFNVAWISFFNTEEGLRVVDDYRRDCIEWCYDRLEDDRFADQKYLDRWPELYPNCCVSRWIGADVAHWNVSQWDLSYFDRHIYVDSEQLIFYHFQGIKLLDTGKYGAGASPEHFGVYYAPLYAPYLAAMDAMELRLKDVLRNVSREPIRRAE